MAQITASEVTVASVLLLARYRSLFNRLLAERFPNRLQVLYERLFQSTDEFQSITCFRETSLTDLQ
jgi:hypothetical protein